MKTELRAIRVPCEERDENFIIGPTAGAYADGELTADESFVLAVTGAQNGVAVGKLYVDV